MGFSTSNDCNRYKTGEPCKGFTPKKKIVRTHGQNGNVIIHKHVFSGYELKTAIVLPHNNQSMIMIIHDYYKFVFYPYTVSRFSAQSFLITWPQTLIGL